MSHRRNGEKSSSESGGATADGNLFNIHLDTGVASRISVTKHPHSDRHGKRTVSVESDATERHQTPAAVPNGLLTRPSAVTSYPHLIAHT